MRRKISRKRSRKRRWKRNRKKRKKKQEEEEKKQEEKEKKPEEEEKKPEEEEMNIWYDAPDFNDFSKLRDKICFKPDQIWALYDGEEGMPRLYALIKEVEIVDFRVQFEWLDEMEDNDFDLPVSVGKFEVGERDETNICTIFSHLVCSITGRITRGRKYTVFPKKGETWALFKNWDSVSPSGYEYDIVEIMSDHEEGTKVTVGLLCKVECYISVFGPVPNDRTCEILPHEFYRFSHCIPSFRIKGTEDAGLYELDPAALPV